MCTTCFSESEEGAGGGGGTTKTLRDPLDRNPQKEVTSYRDSLLQGSKYGLVKSNKYLTWRGSTIDCWDWSNGYVPSAKLQIFGQINLQAKELKRP